MAGVEPLSAGLAKVKQHMLHAQWLLSSTATLCMAPSCQEVPAG
jgi:hypothetical protein